MTGLVTSLLSKDLLVLVTPSSLVYHKQHIVQEGCSDPSHLGGSLDRKEEEMQAGHTSPLKGNFQEIP